MPVLPDAPYVPSLEQLLAQVNPEFMAESSAASERFSGSSGTSPLLAALLAGGGQSGAGTGGYGGSATGGFVPTGSPGSGGSFGLDELLTRRGITGVPAAVRSLLKGARQTDIAPADLSGAIYGEGFRSWEEQNAAYDRYLAGGNLAAEPGNPNDPSSWGSMHQVGRAFDIDSSWLAANPEYRDWLVANGWEFPVAGEPWHAEWDNRAGLLNPPPRIQPPPVQPTTPVATSTPSRPSRQELRRRR